MDSKYFISCAEKLNCFCQGGKIQKKTGDKSLKCVTFVLNFCINSFIGSTNFEENEGESRYELFDS